MNGGFEPTRRRSAPRCMRASDYGARLAVRCSAQHGRGRVALHASRSPRSSKQSLCAAYYGRRRRDLADSIRTAARRCDYLNCISYITPQAPLVRAHCIRPPTTVLPYIPATHLTPAAMIDRRGFTRGAGRLRCGLAARPTSVEFCPSRGAHQGATYCQPARSL